MHVTLVEINVHEDKVDEFIEVFRQNHRSVQEEGNLRFDVLQDPEVNSRFLSTKPIKMKTQWRSIKPRPTTKPVSQNWKL